MRRPALFAGSLLAALAAGLAACTPTSKVAEPDIVMKSAVPPHMLAPCLATELGRNFRDLRPTVDLYRGMHEITVDSPRGEKLAFVTVEPDFADGSVVSFWNGDLYWPDHTVSGVWPDIARDNWHRFEAAEHACQHRPVAAKSAKAAPVAPPPAAAPVQSVTKAAPPKPLPGSKPFIPATTSMSTPQATPQATPGAPRTLVP
jgi:hypothetical protein